MGEINDNYIIDYFYGPTCLKGKLLKNIPNNILLYLNNRYSDSLSVKETLYRIKHNIEIRPVCPICGNNVLFNKKGYFSTTCSKECTNKLRKQHIDETLIKLYGTTTYNNVEKTKKTCLEKYGVENVAQDNNVKNKTKKTCLEKYGVEYITQSNTFKQKTKETCLEKYGVEYITQSNTFKQKTKETCLEKYGVEYATQSETTKQKTKESCLEKYGVEYATQSEATKQKTKETCLEKYGVESPLLSVDIQEKIKQTNIRRYGVEVACNNSEIRKKIINTFKSETSQQKRNNTLSKNNTWNTSSIELLIKQFLLDNNINFIYQYKSDVYPFNCDFYFPDNDLYLEIQGSWTHGGHPYNENDINDIKLANIWKNSSSKYYNNAYQTWVIRDVTKRNIAKQNKLNYHEIFSIKFAEIIEIILNLLN